MRPNYSSRSTTSNINYLKVDDFNLFKTNDDVEDNAQNSYIVQ